MSCNIWLYILFIKFILNNLASRKRIATVPHISHDKSTTDISESEELSEQTTGVPHAMLSKTGKPNPSYVLGET